MLNRLKPMVMNFTHDNGALVIIDKLSYLFVIGSVDYHESCLHQGFQLVNLILSDLVPW